MIYKIPYGSIVYGTYNEKSDIDILRIVENYMPSNPDIHVYTHEEYQNALNNHEVVPVETFYFAKRRFTNFPFEFNLDKWRLRQVFSATASNSWVKAKKKFIDGEIYIGKKSLFHSLRILAFAIMIAKHNSIFFDIMNNFYYEIMGDNDLDNILKRYKYGSNELSSELRIACPKIITVKVENYEQN